jgi:pre-mRNA cleavage complex 2 protein Pcf11
MSLYSQSPPLYGQPYAAPYTQPGLGYHYGQPPLPPPPVYHVDPNTFRRDYSLRLAELTVNSRPIIQSLSMLAQEFTRFAEIVAQCIEAHIRRVSFNPFNAIPLHFLHRWSLSPWFGNMSCRSQFVLPCCFRCHVISPSSC